MSLDKKLIDKLINVTSNASIACHKFVGKNDKIAADKAAVDEMRNELNRINMNGRIVIGEGEMDEAPMLYINEKVGTKTGERALILNFLPQFFIIIPGLIILWLTTPK